MNQAYALRVVTAPPYEPILLAEAKKHILRSRPTRRATMIMSRGSSSPRSEWLEGYTGRAYVLQTLEMTFDAYPGCVIELPRAPVQSIDSIKYVDGNGVEQTWAVANYQSDLNRVPARVALAYGGLLPSSQRTDLGSWKIRFAAGYPVGSPADADGYRQNVPQLAKLAMKVHVMWAFEGGPDSVLKAAESLATSLRTSFL
jgi:uncharacterized phiE125 gp8 family phage protein